MGGTVGPKSLGPVEIRTQDRQARGLVTILTELSPLLYLRRRTQVTLEWEAQYALNHLALLSFEPRIVKPLAWSLY
jgi:hypothetical protein